MLTQHSFSAFQFHFTHHSFRVWPVSVSVCLSVCHLLLLLILIVLLYTVWYQLVLPSQGLVPTWLWCASQEVHVTICWKHGAHLHVAFYGIPVHPFWCSFEKELCGDNAQSWIQLSGSIPHMHTRAQREGGNSLTEKAVEFSSRGSNRTHTNTSQRERERGREYNLIEKTSWINPIPHVQILEHVEREREGIIWQRRYQLMMSEGIAVLCPIAGAGPTSLRSFCWSGGTGWSQVVGRWHRSLLDSRKTSTNTRSLAEQCWQHVATYMYICVCRLNWNKNF